MRSIIREVSRLHAVNLDTPKRTMQLVSPDCALLQSFCPPLAEIITTPFDRYSK
jgi:hypothetical protein